MGAHTYCISYLGSVCAHLFIWCTSTCARGVWVWHVEASSWCPCQESPSIAFHLVFVRQDLLLDLELKFLLAWSECLWDPPIFALTPSPSAGVTITQFLKRCWGAWTQVLRVFTFWAISPAPYIVFSVSVTKQPSRSNSAEEKLPLIHGFPVGSPSWRRRLRGRSSLDQETRRRGYWPSVDSTPGHIMVPLHIQRVSLQLPT